VSVLDGWRYCPRCRAELRTQPGEARCAACGSVYYANPAPTASALVTDAAGRLLLARRAHEPFKGLWDTPGGFLDEREHPLDALRRELREETGLEIEPVAFFGARIDTYGDGPGAQTTLNLYWTARVVSGEPEPADDVAELRWFRPDELPSPVETAFTEVSSVLARWREQQA
jgi:ADP-ribose pyrophosphatase YjhB (NUDIX family)